MYTCATHAAKRCLSTIVFTREGTQPRADVCVCARAFDTVLPPQSHAPGSALCRTTATKVLVVVQHKQGGARASPALAASTEAGTHVPQLCRRQHGNREGVCHPLANRRAAVEGELQRRVHTHLHGRLPATEGAQGGGRPRQDGAGG